MAPLIETRKPYALHLSYWTGAPYCWRADVVRRADRDTIVSRWGTDELDAAHQAWHALSRLIELGQLPPYGAIVDHCVGRRGLAPLDSFAPWPDEGPCGIHLDTYRNPTTL